MTNLGETQKTKKKYDFRRSIADSLTSPRLTIAMWDVSYLLRRNPGEGYENWDKVLDELVERKYNTVRIDPFPAQISHSRADAQPTK